MNYPTSKKYLFSRTKNPTFGFYRPSKKMTLKIGHKLLSIREERRLSQTEMAELLGFPTSTYQRLEKNEKAIEYEKLPAISEALGVPIPELLPENVSISNHHKGDNNQGGVIFGNIYNYGEQNETIKNLEIRIAELEQTNKFKDEKIVLIESQLEVYKSLLEKLGR